MKQSETLHVLVHPHFALAHRSVPVYNRSLKRFDSIEIRRSTRAAMPPRGGKLVERLVKRQEAIDRFYRHSIRRISSDRGARLVILKSGVSGWVPSSKHVKPLIDHLAGFQDRLVEYARKRLGKRLIVLEGSPAKVGQSLKPHVAPQIRVKVFGEFLIGPMAAFGCVDAAAMSLKDAGFGNVEIQENKSIGRL